MNTSIEEIRRTVREAMDTTWPSSRDIYDAERASDAGYKLRNNYVTWLLDLCNEVERLAMNIRPRGRLEVEPDALLDCVWLRANRGTFMVPGEHAVEIADAIAKAARGLTDG